MDKEGFTVVITLERLEYLLRNGVHIYMDQNNLAYSVYIWINCGINITQ